MHEVELSGSIVDVRVDIIALKGIGIAQEIGAHGGLLALGIDHHAGVDQVGPEVGRRGPAGQNTQRGDHGQNRRKKRTR